VILDSGKKKESPIVILFSFRKSTTTRSFGFPNASTYFGTNNGAFHWLTLVLIILLCSISFICRFTSSLCFSGKRYGRTFTGAASARMFISWVTVEYTVLLHHKIHPDISCILLWIAYFSSLLKCSVRNSCQIRSARGTVDFRFLFVCTVSIFAVILCSTFSTVMRGVVILTALFVVLMILTGHSYFLALIVAYIGWIIITSQTSQRPNVLPWEMSYRLQLQSINSFIDDSWLRIECPSDVQSSSKVWIKW